MPTEVSDGARLVWMPSVSSFMILAFVVLGECVQNPFSALLKMDLDFRLRPATPGTPYRMHLMAKLSPYGVTSDNRHLCGKTLWH